MPVAQRRALRSKSGEYGSACAPSHTETLLPVRNLGERYSFLGKRHRELRRCSAEADLRNFALSRRADLEKLTRLEVEHARNDVGRELCDFRVEVAHHRVVIATRVLDAVFNLIQRVLKLSERFHGAQLRVR